jgi:FkbM family methyltransferase
MATSGPHPRVRGASGRHTTAALARPVRRALRRLGFDIVRYPRDDEGKLGAHLVALFEQLRVNCVLDVGAHWGEYGTLLRDWSYTGRIVSFEPVAESASILEERAGDDPKWRVERLALGSRSRSASMHVYSASDLASFLTLNDYAADLYPDDTVLARQETVTICRLDEIIGQIDDENTPGTFFLKVDTQGLDLDVIAGAEGCLPRIRGIQLEAAVQPLYDGVADYLHTLEHLRQLGYKLTGAFPISRDRELGIIELDCVFTQSSA